MTFLRADTGKDELLVRAINCSGRPFAGKVNLKNVDGFVPVKISGLQSSNDGPLPAFQLNGFEWRINIIGW